MVHGGVFRISLRAGAVMCVGHHSIESKKAPLPGPPLFVIFLENVAIGVIIFITRTARLG